MKTPGFKTCTLCGTTRPVSEFSKSKFERDGLQKWCIHCRGIHAKREQMKV